MTGDGGGSSFGGAQTHAQKVEDLTGQLVTYQTKMSMLGQKIGNDPYRLNPYLRQGLENTGELPQPSAGVGAYLEWSTLQPEGSDISIDAYVTYLEAQKVAA